MRTIMVSMLLVAVMVSPAMAERIDLSFQLCQSFSQSPRVHYVVPEGKRFIMRARRWNIAVPQTVSTLASVRIFLLRTEPDGIGRLNDKKIAEWYLTADGYTNGIEIIRNVTTLRDERIFQAGTGLYLACTNINLQHDVVKITLHGVLR